MDPKIVLFGFGVGFLVGMTGMGGGSLMTPLLVLLFGVKPTTAIGTDIAYAAITKTAGSWRHLKLRTVNMPLVYWMAIGSVPMAIVGVWFLDFRRRCSAASSSRRRSRSATTSRCTPGTRWPRSGSARRPGS
jgi:uncharacterized membrane protein YfcA